MEFKYKIFSYIIIAFVLILCAASARAGESLIELPSGDFTAPSADLFPARMVDMRKRGIKKPPILADFLSIGKRTENQQNVNNEPVASPRAPIAQNSVPVPIPSRPSFWESLLGVVLAFIGYRLRGNLIGTKDSEKLDEILNRSREWNEPRN